MAIDLPPESTFDRSGWSVMASRMACDENHRAPKLSRSERSREARPWSSSCIEKREQEFDMRRVWLSAVLLMGVALPAQAGPLTISNITGSWLNIAACLGGDPDPFHCTPAPNPDPANVPAHNNPENPDGAIVTTGNVAGQGMDQIRWCGTQDTLCR